MVEAAEQELRLREVEGRLPALSLYQAVRTTARQGARLDSRLRVNKATRETRYGFVSHRLPTHLSHYAVHFDEPLTSDSGPVRSRRRDGHDFGKCDRVRIAATARNRLQGQACVLTFVSGKVPHLVELREESGRQGSRPS
jgi:hypothetical protein